MTTEQSESIKSILTKLESGKKLTLSFPSPKERELFRVALYKSKREVDEIFLMTDSTYEVDVLCFEKLTHLDGEAWPAVLSITKKDDLPKRGYSFSIIGEEGPTNEQSSNPDRVDPPS